LDEAIALDEELLKLRKAKLGTDHRDTLISRINLADAYRDAGRPEAIALNETTLKMLENGAANFRIRTDEARESVCSRRIAIIRSTTRPSRRMARTVTWHSSTKR
jgi:hypothetical protein